MPARRRANPTATTGSGSKSILLVAAAVVGVLVVGMIAFSLMQDDDVSFTCTPVSGFADVHGLAVAPDDTSLVYVATHHGLMRGTDDKDWCRLGASQDDFMGFTMHPENGSVFWVSGHPRLGGNMGVRQSTDGGYTWATLALEGVDFHAMTVSPADPDRLWGSFRGQVYRTDDGGHEWTIVGDAPQGLASLAGAPDDADTVYAATTAGLSRSSDGGATWFRVSGVPLTAFVVHPDMPQTMLASTPDGEIIRSDNGGEDWAPVGFQAASLGHITYARGDPAIAYAASYRGELYKSTDGGASWARIL